MSFSRIQNAYLADTARVVGEVELGADVSVWYSSVIRGDVAKITLGDGVNVQDGTVIHCDFGKPLTIEKNVTIGHGAVVHCVHVGEGTLIGMGARVLGGVKIGKHCLIAAGAVISPNQVIPDHSVVMGVPGKVVRETNTKEKEYMAWLAPHYVKLAKMHAEQPDDPRVLPYHQQ